MELFPGFFSNPKVTYLADIGGKKLLNTIANKLNNQVELDEMDAYYLALIPFFHHEKSRGEVLDDMCHFINKIEISEEFKYIVKLVQILSAKAMFADDKQEEILGVVKVGSTYIDNYEKNLVKNAVKKNMERVALKMKDLGADPDFIFACTGLKL